jgi:UDP-N-acetylglucosamine 4,6-dehydratase/5-epimerase
MRILITGATGFLGRALVRRLQNDTLVERLCVLSRDEHKISKLAAEYNGKASLRTFVGDIRDTSRLTYACRGVDAVIHAAALKRIDAVVNESIELDKTNVQGTRNVLEASLQSGVRKVLFTSSDKAAEPCNAYGASKMMAECHAIGFNAYSIPQGMAVAAVRYGNVFASTGSIYHIWKKCLEEDKPLPITDPNMTRFHISIDQAVEFCLTSLQRTIGGEIFVPDLPAFRLQDLAKAMLGLYDYQSLRDQEQAITVGLRPGGEKLAEIMLSQEEPGRTLWQRDRYLVMPAHRSWSASPYEGKPVVGDPHLRSDWQSRWLTVDQLKKIVEETKCTLSS